MTLLNYLINNQYNELYNCLTDDLKSKTKPDDLNGALTKTEEMFGKYKGNEPWEIRKYQEYKTYCSILNYEKGKAGLIIIFDENGKVSAVTFVPDQVIKDMPAY